MSHEATLIYSEPLLRQAVFGFCRRSFGIGFVIALVGLALCLGVLVAQNPKTWLDGVIVGAFSAALVLCSAGAATMYFVHYRNVLRKFRAMGSPEAIFLAEEPSFTLRAFT